MNHVAVTHSLEFWRGCCLPAAWFPSARLCYFCRSCSGRQPISRRCVRGVPANSDPASMEGRCSSLGSLTAVCFLLAGALLLPPLPGDGQNLSSAPPSTVSHSLPPHNETSSLGLWTSAPTVTSVDRNTTVTSQLNASSSSPPKSLAPATLSSLNTTEGPQNTDHGTNRSVDVSSLPIPIANSVEANQTNLDDAKPINSTLGVTSSTSFMATEPSQAKEAQGPTTAPQPKSSIFSTLRPTERTSETTLVTNHEAITEENTAESTSVPSAIVTDRRVVTLEAFSTTPEAVSSTLLFHRATSMDTEKPANHVQGKTFVSDTKDYDMPSVPAASPAGEDPLVIAVIFTFVVTVGILALMGFLRYRQRSSRLQFRRLQDLPMDDMEDTPLSRYSY